MRPQRVTIVTPDPKMAAQTNGNYERHAISTDRRGFVVSPQLLLLFLERGLVPNI
jgi:hypothetical protein